MDTLSWTWLCPHPLILAWLTLCQIHSSIEFHFLPVYNPSEEEKQDADLYAENVRKLMSKYLDIPMSDYSYEDGRVMYKVYEHKLPASIGLVKVKQLSKKLG
jgi:lysophosphatidylcholine acyltransferase / lyso-PAF acetyltransferase